MRKKHALCIVLISHLFIYTLYAQDFKKNCFGIGIGVGAFNGFSYNKTPEEPVFFRLQGTGYILDGGEVLQDYDLNASFIYEYSFSKKISLSTNPTYIFKHLKYSPNQTIIFNDYGAMLSFSTTVYPHNYYLHQLDIPIVFNYKLYIGNYSNILLGVGGSALINMYNSKNIYEYGFDFVGNSTYEEYLLRVKPISPNLILKTGLEFNDKHRIQVYFQSRIGLSKSTNYGKNYSDNFIKDVYTDFEKFSINSFTFGINYFFK